MSMRDYSLILKCRLTDWGLENPGTVTLVFIETTTKETDPYLANERGT